MFATNDKSHNHRNFLNMSRHAPENTASIGKWIATNHASRLVGKHIFFSKPEPHILDFQFFY
jgi:hypothetical protein